MDELVSVPVTHPVRFLKGTIKAPPVSPPVRKDPPVRSSPPVRQPVSPPIRKDPPLRRNPPKTSSHAPVKKNLAQEWLEF